MWPLRSTGVYVKLLRVLGLCVYTCEHVTNRLGPYWVVEKIAGMYVCVCARQINFTLREWLCVCMCVCAECVNLNLHAL